MSWDFALLLFVALVVTGLVWLLDVGVLRGRRRARAEAAAQACRNNAAGLDPDALRVECDQAYEQANRPSWWVEYCVSFFPVILLGIFWKRATREGAIAGMVTGLVFTATVIGLLRAPQIFGAAAPVIPDVFGITAQGVGTIGMVLNLVVMVVVSLLTPPPPQEVQEMVERIRYAGEPAVTSPVVAVE